MSVSPSAQGTSHPAPRHVAIAHDWLTGMRGGEKVLQAICELYPDADLYTLVRVPGAVSPTIARHPIHTSFVQWLPRVARYYRQYLPLFPAAVELFDLDRYDLVISSSHCAVKSVVPAGGARHICYCHSPMRYAWDQFGAYFGADQVGRVRSQLMRPVMAGMARWDAATAHRVNRFLANSQYVAGRIRRYYNRRSTVVYPPVDTDYYRPEPGGPSGAGALVVSALVPYKRIDLALEACRLARIPLTIVGHGPEEVRLRRLAGPEVQWLGWRNDEEIRDLYRQSAVVLLPGIEDFGIVPVEAQACGTPVVAYDAGGARETVIPGATGALVGEASPEAFATAIRDVAGTSLDRYDIRLNAERFSVGEFKRRFQESVETTGAGIDS